MPNLSIKIENKEIRRNCATVLATVNGQPHKIDIYEDETAPFIENDESLIRDEIPYMTEHAWMDDYYLSKFIETLPADILTDYLIGLAA